MPTPLSAAANDEQDEGIVTAIDAAIARRRRAGNSARDAIDDISFELAQHVGRLNAYLATSERDLGARSRRSTCILESSGRMTYGDEVKRAVERATTPPSPRRLR